MKRLKQMIGCCILGCLLTIATGCDDYYGYDSYYGYDTGYGSSEADIYYESMIGMLTDISLQNW